MDLFQHKNLFCVKNSLESPLMDILYYKLNYFFRFQK